MKTCAIVANGPSARDLPEIKPDCLIAINGAIDLVDPDVWFTIDPSRANLKIINNPRPGVEYYAAFGDGWKVPDHCHDLQRVSYQGKAPAEVGSPAFWFWRWACCPGFSDTPGEVHSGNSAYAALNWAYQQDFNKVALFGVDADSSRQRATGGYTANLSHMPMLFASAVKQIREKGLIVVNANPDSKVKCFKTMTQREAARWIRSDSL